MLCSSAFVFIDNKNIYNPGDALNGNVIIESRGQVKINSLKVFIRGVAKVHWTGNPISFHDTSKRILIF